MFAAMIGVKPCHSERRGIAGRNRAIDEYGGDPDQRGSFVQAEDSAVVAFQHFAPVTFRSRGLLDDGAHECARIGGQRSKPNAAKIPPLVWT